MDSSKNVLRLYNSLSKGEEAFTPLIPGKVTMYTCGPTVYGRPHIGNYSSFLMADLLRRWLQYGLEYQVTHVKNITDVGHLVADQDQGEDKIEKQARAEQTDPLQIAKKYTEQYLADEEALNMIEPEHRPKATETIQEMLQITKELLRKGYAYDTDDAIYFDVRKFRDYGKLSGNNLDDLCAGVRIDVNEAKHCPADFALWKKCVGVNSHHLLRWTFETGERAEGDTEDPSAGFPGWHIECSAMSTKFLGRQIDIHTGGEDNIFPHHECEIAQTEAVTGKQFVQMWLHKRRIDMGSQKMSKSMGNVLTLSDIEEMGYSPLDLRYYFLSVHYRTQLKFAEKGLADARKARLKVAEWMDGVLSQERKHGEQPLGWKPVDEPNQAGDRPLVAEFTNRFVAAMNSDLNTPAALAAVFDCMAATRNFTYLDVLEELEKFMRLVQKTFGCFELEAKQAVPTEVQALVDRRAQARADKDFAASDQLRDQIAELGYEVRDTGEGQAVKRM